MERSVSPRPPASLDGWRSPGSGRSVREPRPDSSRVAFLGGFEDRSSAPKEPGRQQLRGGLGGGTEAGALFRRPTPALTRTNRRDPDTSRPCSTWYRAPADRSRRDEALGLENREQLPRAPYRVRFAGADGRSRKGPGGLGRMARGRRRTVAQASRALPAVPLEEFVPRCAADAVVAPKVGHGLVVAQHGRDARPACARSRGRSGASASRPENRVRRTPSATTVPHVPGHSSSPWTRTAPPGGRDRGRAFPFGARTPRPNQRTN